jgi:outer membrane protein TolC
LTNLEWIDAHVALQAAEQAHTSAYHDLVQAIADYYQSMGRVLELLEE